MASSRDLLVDRLGLLGVRAGLNPVARALGDQRVLEVHVRHRVAVVQPLRKLERALHVLLRGLVVARLAIAARAPLEDVRAEVVGDGRALDELEGLRVQGQGRGERIQLDAAAAEVVEHLRAVDVRGGRPLRDLAGAVEDGDRLADLAQVHARPRFGEEGAQGELGSGHRVEGRGERRELGDGLLVPAVLDRGLGAHDHALDALALARGDAGLEEARVDAETSGQPFDGLEVGRVFPRSIWLTYSLEKRSPARSVCVSPRAIRSCLTRPREWGATVLGCE